MYTVNKTRSRKKLIFTFIFSLVLIFVIVCLLIWYFILKDSDDSTSQFIKSGGNTTAYVEPATANFKTTEFKMTLPEGWELLGKKNPNVDSVFYAFKSQIKNYDNRWLNVYVDVYPEDYVLSKLLPVTIDGNKIIPGTISGNCKDFKGSPKSGSSSSSEVWVATWQDITFNCNMSSSINHIGTASIDSGYGVPITGETSGEHKYFFVYIDHNVRPDYSIMTNALKSFEAL